MRLQLLVKTAIDRVGAVVGLVVLSPLLLIVAISIKASDRGPVFFRQERLGRDAQRFEVVKFRTMIVGADDHLDDQGRPTRERITRIGKLLRRTSLDELPQLVNVAAGQMSLIGPRPVPVAHEARYTAEQHRRFRMRPGVTGLAQVSGRNEIPWSERIRLDNEYIDNYSLWLDARLLVMTFRVAFGGSGVVLDRNPGDVDDLGPPRNGDEPAATNEVTP